MSTYNKARKLLTKLFEIRRMDFRFITVNDILAKATSKEIDFYYNIIIDGGGIE